MTLPFPLVLAFLMQAPAPDTALPAHVLNLAQIRRNVQTAAMQVPDYTCLETIERFGRSSAKQTLRRLDTLQLEVGIVGNKEVYSWPGAESFEEITPGEIVSMGTVSTGEFMSLLRAVFIGGTSVIRWHGEETLFGRRALRYDYTLPLFGYKSHVNLAGGSGDVSLRGSFWADAESLELMRLESHADEVPPGLPLAEMVSRIDYGKMTVRDQTVWFPQSAEVRLVQLSGQETRNRIEFSHCRQYAGTSTLRFDLPDPASPAPQATPLERVDLPPGVMLTLRLETAIDSSMGVGAPVTARLESNALHRKNLLLPAGALVRGRIRRMERSTDVTPHFVVGVEFSAIEHGNQRARFYGLLQSVQPVTGLSTGLVKVSSGSRHYPGTASAAGFRVETGSSETLHFRDLPGVGTFFMTGTEFRLPTGLQMTWQTVPLPAGRP